LLADYVTIDDLADYMEVDVLTTENALGALWAAEEAVRRYLDQDITSSVGIEIRDGNDRQFMRLKQRPVRRLDYVMVDEVQLDSGEWKLRGARVALPSGYFTYGIDNVQFQYLHGYDLTSHGDWSVPAVIRLVTLSAARRAYQSKGEGTGTEGSETIGKYSYTNDTEATDFAVDLLKSEMDALDLYKIQMVI